MILVVFVNTCGTDKRNRVGALVLGNGWIQIGVRIVRKKYEIAQNIQVFQTSAPYNFVFPKMNKITCLDETYLKHTAYINICMWQ